MYKDYLEMRLEHQKTDLIFVHISDIHSERFSNHSYGIDSEFRNGMLRDLRNYAKVSLDNVCGILVCGDLVFSDKWKNILQISMTGGYLYYSNANAPS